MCKYLLTHIIQIVYAYMSYIKSSITNQGPPILVGILTGLHPPVSALETFSLTQVRLGSPLSQRLALKPRQGRLLSGVSTSPGGAVV